MLWVHNSVVKNNYIKSKKYFLVIIFFFSMTSPSKEVIDCFFDLLNFVYPYAKPTLDLCFDKDISLREFKLLGYTSMTSDYATFVLSIMKAQSENGFEIYEKEHETDEEGYVIMDFKLTEDIIVPKIKLNEFLELKTKFIKFLNLIVPNLNLKNNESIN